MLEMRIDGHTLHANHLSLYLFRNERALIKIIGEEFNWRLIIGKNTG